MKSWCLKAMATRKANSWCSDVKRANQGQGNSPVRLISGVPTTCTHRFTGPPCLLCHDTSIMRPNRWEYDSLASEASKMQITELLDELGYQDSPNFLRRRQSPFETAPFFGHIFRRARAKLGLEGVYTLRSDPESAAGPVVPLVYVCRASSEPEADRIHRLVWNQDVAPFLSLICRPVSSCIPDSVMAGRKREKHRAFSRRRND